MITDDNGVADDPEHFEQFLRLWFKSAAQRHDALRRAEDCARCQTHDLWAMWATCIQSRKFVVQAEGQQHVMQLCWREMELAVMGDERCP